MQEEREHLNLQTPVGVPFETKEGRAVIIRKPTGYLYWFCDDGGKKLRLVGIEHEGGVRGYNVPPSELTEAEREAREILFKK